MRVNVEAGKKITAKLTEWKVIPDPSIVSCYAVVRNGPSIFLTFRLQTNGIAISDMHIEVQNLKSKKEIKEAAESALFLFPLRPPSKISPYLI